MQPRGGMLLDHEAQSFSLDDFLRSARLAGLGEIALGAIGGELLQCHATLLCRKAAGQRPVPRQKFGNPLGKSQFNQNKTVSSTSGCDMLDFLLRRYIHRGSLTVRYPGGKTRAYGQGEPRIAIALKNRRALLALSLDPDLKLG